MAASGTTYSDEGDEPLITDINVTPLVDVVLVLLIVFMITVPTMVALDALKERELKVQLPQASEAKPLIAKPDALVLVVNIDAEGKFIVKQNQRIESELLDLFKQALVDNPGRANVIIRGDKDSHLQQLATVINLCNKAGIRFSWVTK